MAGVISDLKAQARVLHRQVIRGEEVAVARVRHLPELSGCDAGSLGGRMKRRHCLAVLARELGFAGWPHDAA